MNRNRSFLLEKLQVWAALLGLLAAVYWVVSPWLLPADPTGPIVLLPGSELGGLMLLGLVLLVLAIISGVVTPLSRPEGAMAVVLLGLGGLALRSGPAKFLMWSYGQPLRGMYLQMIVEMLLLIPLLGLAEILVDCGRAWVGRIFSKLLWRDLLAELSEKQLVAIEDIPLPSGKQSFWLLVIPPALLPGAIRRLLGGQGDKVEVAKVKNSPQARRAELQRLAGCLAVGVAVGIVLVNIILQSPARWQILFGLFASFLLAAILANYLFPVSCWCVFWIMPIVAAVVLYACAALGDSPTSGVGLANVRPIFQVLPIDWLTAGCGGAMLGVWISERLREVHIIETLGEPVST
ncbi:MAG: hypothetical protein K8S55_02530 [Phycisphaerae bacterium]|nr:hypothetical protein [Phycisphaerae bacterium]